MGGPLANEFNVKKCKTLRITRKRKNKTNYTYLMSTPHATTTTIDAEAIVYEAATEILQVNPPSISKFSPLDEIESDRYLGVILDNKISFNSHIDAICKKATNLLNLCRRNLHMCSANIKENAYKSIVRPQLDYASPAWSPHTSKNIDRLEAIQRRAARFVLNNYEYGPDANLTHKIQNQLKWLPLHHRRALYDLALFFKIKHSIVNIPFPPTVLVSPRAPASYINIQATHSDAYKYSYFPRTVRLWNQLPTNIQQMTSLQSFKTSTSSWITTLGWVKVNNTWALM